MGGGSSDGIGGPTTKTYDVGGLSGQGGGRIMPATTGGIGELIVHVDSVTGNRLPQTADTTRGPDRRPTPPYGWILDTIFSSAGGGPAEAGMSIDYPVFYNGTETLPTGTCSGGGGGWGASGGNSVNETVLITDAGTPNLGAAGGKAIQTNGHAVTWLGGSSRAYGAIG